MLLLLVNDSQTNQQALSVMSQFWLKESWSDSLQFRAGELLSLTSDGLWRVFLKQENKEAAACLSF